MTVDICDATGEAVAVFHELIKPRGLADPYPRYARLQRLAPVLDSPLPATLGGFVLTRYADCALMLRDRRFESLGAEHLDRLVPGWRDDPHRRRIYRTIGFLNGGAHRTLRTAVSRHFGPSQIATMQELVVATTDRLLDEFAERLAGGAEVDLIETLAVPVSAIVAGSLVGLDAERSVEIAWPARQIAGVIEPLVTPLQRRRVDEALGQVFAFFSDFAAGAQARENGLVASMASALADGPPGEEGLDLVDNLAFFFSAGFDSPVSMIGLGTRTLLEHPDQAELVREDPAAAAGATEELLRYEPPVQLAVRVATEDVAISDVVVDTGRAVLALIGAANRDPDHVSDPHRFDVRRPPVPNLSLGAGPHYCLGASLFRLQAQVLFPRLLRRFPTLRLAGTPSYRSPGFALRGIERLPVTLSE